jgi:hypothetical protein
MSTPVAEFLLSSRGDDCRGAPWRPRHEQRAAESAPRRERPVIHSGPRRTDCCARHTSGDAFQRGYELVWITDAMQAFTDEAHAQGLEYFKTWYASDAAAQLKTADEVIAEWRAAAPCREPAALSQS